MERLEYGALGEDMAASYVEDLGWRIIGRNVRVGTGELDITAFDGDELVIVEVRARKIGRLTPAEMTVGPRKIKRLIRAARKYVDAIAFMGNWRIDVVAVTEDWDGRMTLELFRDVTTGMEGGCTG
jgi:putative endonuclease